MSNVIFYFGAVLIITFFIGIAIKRFKEDDNIDLNEHKWIIITYLVLLVLAIISWRVLVLMIESKIIQITKHNKTIEKFMYGQK
jgi:NADH:ubiquinone oxidoreductase subunit 6 (subunit J)